MEMEKTFRAVARTDSSAAKSFVCRRGLGSMRHIDIGELWIQEEVRLGRLLLYKVPGGTTQRT